MTMNTKRKREWFDDDALWQLLMPMMFSKERCGDATEALPKALKLVQPTGKDVLDLCCGPGRWAIPFARDRFRVTGVDRTKRFLDRARADAKRAGVRIEWVRQDMRDFVRPAAFDLADDLLRPGIARPSGASRIRRRAALRLLRRNGLRPERPALDRGGTEAGVNALPSGGCVVDHFNSSGLGDGATPPMVAFWASTDNLNQCISYSRDRGRTWTKYPKKPVLVHPYRDPKVFGSRCGRQGRVLARSLGPRKRHDANRGWRPATTRGTGCGPTPGGPLFRQPVAAWPGLCGHGLRPATRRQRAGRPQGRIVRLAVGDRRPPLAGWPSRSDHPWQTATPQNRPDMNGCWVPCGALIGPGAGNPPRLSFSPPTCRIPGRSPRMISSPSGERPGGSSLG